MTERKMTKRDLMLLGAVILLSLCAIIHGLIVEFS